MDGILPTAGDRFGRLRIRLKLPAGIPQPLLSLIDAP